MRWICLLLVAVLIGACVGLQPVATPVTPIAASPQSTALLSPSLSATVTPSPSTTTTLSPTQLPTATAEPTTTATPTAALQPSTTPDPSAPPLKAVFIVGPEEHLTEGNLAEAEQMALEAESAGMDVRRVFFPHATWENVLAEVQGASLVAYLGHGYGYPSNTPEMQEIRQNGMGLNAFDGSGDAEVEYYGASLIRENIRLAPGAVVVLLHGCYTSGNGLWGTPIPTPEVARERVDNYASGWQAAGAAAVFAFQYGTRLNYVDVLMRTDTTIDLIFMNDREHVGSNDLYFDSVRTPGSVSHLDPDPTLGFLRAVTGDLQMTTAEWRSGAGQIVSAVPGETTL